jgi:broad specificity phosphatase PhoE
VPKVTIHCVRHAQGYHNLNKENEKLPDPILTPFGVEQCKTLQRTFPYHDKITHLVASPLRRAIYTCLVAFESSVRRGKKVIALPEIQETSDMPCDTGSDPAKLKEEFESGIWRGTVDLNLVHEGWNDKSIYSKYAPTPDKITARAKEARRWIRDLGLKSGEDSQIVVVTHGGYLHYFTEDWFGRDKFGGMSNASFATFLHKYLTNMSQELAGKTPNFGATHSRMRRTRMRA